MWTGSEILIWGGTNDRGTCLNDGARLNPSTGKWTPITTVGAPVARAIQTAVWTGSEMIVLGGCFGAFGAAFGDGARCNPATDIWSAISNNGAPLGRFGHSSVWTGAEMIVSNTGPALAVVLPPDLMPWVFLATVELSVVGVLPVAFFIYKRQRQRWALSLVERS